MRGTTALRGTLAAIVAVGACLLASAAMAAPSAVPQPTPPPGGGGSTGGGGSSGGGTTTRRPVGPVAVADGQAGAVLLEATGERTRAPIATTSTTEQVPPTATEPPVTTAATPVTTAEAPATTAAKPPAPTATQPAPVESSGHGDSVLSSLPRDGIAVLVGILLLGFGVAFQAIRSHERRIGWALLTFCVVYLLTLAGLAAGVAGGGH
jgi:hypothetical protein